MSTHIVVIDDYHRGLIEEQGAAVLHIGTQAPKAAEPEAPAEDEAVTEVKVVRRGRPRKTQATEGVETK